jgi:hypothetical protein
MLKFHIHTDPLKNTKEGMSRYTDRNIKNKLEDVEKELQEARKRLSTQVDTESEWIVNFSKNKVRMLEYQYQMLDWLSVYTRFRIPVLFTNDNQRAASTLWDQLSIPIEQDTPGNTVLVVHEISARSFSGIRYAVFGIQAQIKRLKNDKRFQNSKFALVLIISGTSDYNSTFDFKTALENPFPEIFEDYFPLKEREMNIEPEYGATGLKLYEFIASNFGEVLSLSLRKTGFTTFQAPSIPVSKPIGDEIVAVEYFCMVCETYTTKAMKDEYGDVISICGQSCALIYMEEAKKGLFEGGKGDFPVNAVLLEALSDTTAKILFLSDEGNRELIVMWIGRYFYDPESTDQEQKIRLEYLKELCERKTLAFAEDVGDGYSQLRVYNGGKYFEASRIIRDPEEMANLETVLEAVVTTREGEIKPLPSDYDSNFAGKSSMPSGRNWIHVSHPGRLRNYAMHHNAAGKRVKTSHGLLKGKSDHLSNTDLQRMQTQANKKHDRTLQREVQFAKTMAKMRQSRH